MRPRPLAEINITPLIDVMLVLLIIFMVVTPVASKGLDVGLPAKSGDTKDGRTVTPLVLSIAGSGLSLNRSPVPSLGELAVRLREQMQSRTDRTLFVQADDDVAYRVVVDALDVAKGAGVERIGVIPPAAAQ